jgi:hypothetical protein
MVINKNEKFYNCPPKLVIHAIGSRHIYYGLLQIPIVARRHPFSVKCVQLPVDILQTR